MSKLIFHEESNKGFSQQKSAESQGDHIHSVKDPPTIRDVWENNFEEEFRIIMNLAEKYRVIGMDTEFPGIVARLSENDLAQLSSVNEIEYQTIKLNTDKLKVIQVGISFATEDGYLPEKVPSWQFNFKFDLAKDDYANDAIKLLTNSGLKFEKHATQGISPQLFAEYLIGSGLLFNEDIKWISFHGGFDFAYLIKMLHGQNLPDDEMGFYNLLNIYFPTFYDVKCMVRDIDTLKRGSLNKIASDLNVRRIGPQHQAGSDSLLTIATYFQLKKSYFTTYSETRYANVLYGVGSTVEDELDDYVWQNFLGPDYSPVMYTHGYGMQNGSMLDQYHVQPDSYYNSHYGMAYGATYPGYNMTPYMDTGSKFYNKYDMEIAKAKN